VAEGTSLLDAFGVVPGGDAGLAGRESIGWPLVTSFECWEGGTLLSSRLRILSRRASWRRGRVICRGMGM
jgi:hypothetical protein